MEQFVFLWFHVEPFSVIFNSMNIYKGNIVDPVAKTIFKGELVLEKGIVKSIEKKDVEESVYILPGLIDSHIHIESSMLTPQNFSRMAVKHGTVATVSDPHEIANVLGEEGIEYMIRNARGAEIKIFFGVPSCVPATDFESSGAKIDSLAVRRLLKRDDLYFLSEMMNYPGVIHQDEEVMQKMLAAKENNKKIDGHAPGLTGNDLQVYCEAGITSDHECFSADEALEKIRNGMMIQIREGSAAKNFNSLFPLLNKYPDRIMLCSDDLHPDDLIKGHVNLLFKRAVSSGVEMFSALRALTVNPVNHYSLPVGLLQLGDPADLIIVDNLKDFNILKTIIDGKLVYDSKLDLSLPKQQELKNSFYRNHVVEKDIVVCDRAKKIKVIDIIDGELITRSRIAEPKVVDGNVVQDMENDILKIVVQNRYEKEKPATGFIGGFQIKSGGLVSSIAHDSHNIIALGTNDRIIIELINWINEHNGGIAVHAEGKITGLELPVAGIISDRPAEEVAKIYSAIETKAKELGCNLKSPFMTLSFMSLLVIPELKLGNKGLFDVNKFQFTSLFEE